MVDFAHRAFLSNGSFTQLESSIWDNLLFDSAGKFLLWDFWDTSSAYNDDG